MKPIATFVSDIHLSLAPPSCRAETDWLKVQADYLRQLKDIAQGSPIICAGDVFDKWNAPLELIHFALEHLPDGMLCVPGRHDLPNHCWDQIHRGGYGVLKRVKKIRDLQAHVVYPEADCLFCGFGWGQRLEPFFKPEWNGTCIAVVYQHIYLNQKSAYPGAPAEAKLSNVEKMLQTYDAAVIGNNHIPWQKGNIINPGGFIRRRYDESERPCYVGILNSDGEVELVELNATKDKFQIEGGTRGLQGESFGVS